MKDIENSEWHQFIVFVHREIFPKLIEQQTVASAPLRHM
jgi:hypothetical protein